MPKIWVNLNEVTHKYVGYVKIGNFRLASSYISEIVQDRDIVTRKDDRNSFMVCQMVLFPMTLSGP